MKFTKLSGALALLSALALAACGGGNGNADTDGDGEISVDEMRAEVESQGTNLRPEAGNYSVTMNLVNVEIPGAPPEVIDMMGSMMNNTFEYCLTPEDAEKGFEESLTEGQDESCTVERFDLDGGDIDMAMSCSPQGGGNMRVEMSGNVSPTRSDIRVVTNGTMPQVGETNMEMTMVQERLGDCAAAERIAREHGL